MKVVAYVSFSPRFSPSGATVTGASIKVTKTRPRDGRTALRLTFDVPASLFTPREAEITVPEDMADDITVEVEE